MILTVLFKSVRRSAVLYTLSKIKFNKFNKRALVVLLNVALLSMAFISQISPVLADSNVNQSSTINITDRTEKLLVNSPNADFKTVSKDLHLLDKSGIPIDKIDKINVQSNSYVYEVCFKDNVKDEISVNKSDNGTVTLKIKENEISNEVVLYKNGEIYLDGKKVIIEEKAEPLRVPGITYTKTPPREVKRWRGYSLNWVCSNIKTQKALSDMSYGAIIALLKTSRAGSVAIACLEGVLAQIKTENPYSDKVSYKIWVANSKVPSTSRYIKIKRVLYGQANFKGKGKTSYFYGRRG